MSNPNRLLISDGSGETGSLISHIAEEVGYLVTRATNRKQFRNAYQKKVPSLVVLGLNTPDIDTIDYMRVLAKELCQAPIVLTSGTDARLLATTRHLGLSFGLKMGEVLQTPVTADAVRTMLATASIGLGTRSAWYPSAAAIRQAVVDGELLAYFQPNVDLQQQDAPIISCEALVRWRHPIRGIIPPKEFLAVVEQASMMGLLTDAVLTFVVRQLLRWRQAGVARPVSMNLSASQLEDLTLPDRIIAALDEAGLDRSLLRIEIAERAAMANAEVTSIILTRLRLNGISVGLDNYTAQFSPLQQLLSLPLRELKLDRSLVQLAARDAASNTLVRTIVAIGQEAGLTIGAEGVETIEMARMLQAMGCQEGQGFCFSKPLDADDFTDLLQRQQNRADLTNRPFPTYI